MYMIGTYIILCMYVCMYIHVLPTCTCIQYANVCVSTAENCLDRHVEKNSEKPAFIWEKDEPGTHEIVTYG